MRLREVYPDDALIVMRYAANLLAGHGWVYNLGDPVNASTSPLHVLLLVLLGRLTGGDLMTAQMLGFALPLGVAVVLAWHVFRPHGRTPAAVAALLLAVAPGIYATLGMETALLIASTLAATAAHAGGRPGRAGVFLGLATLARPDAALLGGVLALDILRERRQLAPAVRLLAGAAVVLLPWLVFAVARFGSPLPNTLAVKLAQRRFFGDGAIFLEGAWRELVHIDVRAFGIAAPGLACLFLAGFAATALGARRHRAIALFCAWAILQFGAYAIFDLPPYHWYYAPAMAAAALAVGVLVERLWNLERARHCGVLAGGLAAGLLVATAWPDVATPQPTLPHYRAAGSWLARHTPPTASIAVADIGILGFRAWPRTIVDMQGLVTPGAAQAIAAGRTGWWFDRFRPDYVVVHANPWPDFEGPVLDRTDFQLEYRPLDSARIPGLTIYHRLTRGASAAPTPR